MITSKYSLDANSGFTGGIMEVKVSMGGYIDQPNNKKVRSFLEQNEAIENNTCFVVQCSERYNSARWVVPLLSAT
jgi:hypothetical protein